MHLRRLESFYRANPQGLTGEAVDTRRSTQGDVRGQSESQAGLIRQPSETAPTTGQGEFRRLLA